MKIKNCVYPFVMMLLTLSSNCKKDNAITNPPVNINVPAVTTDTVSSITNNAAMCGGNITSDGGAAVIARGVCWSTSQNPTIDSNKTTDGSGTGSFVSNIGGLMTNTTYFVRAYATNNSGTGYGENVTFKTKTNTISNWQQCKPLPEAMIPAVVTVNGKIYAIKVRADYLNEASSMYEYDPIADSWTKKGAMNTIRTDFELVESNGRIYAIGGLTNNNITTSAVEEFDISNGVWIIRNSLPAPRVYMGVVVVQGKFYAVGGVKRDAVQDSSCNSVFEYNPTLNSWVSKSTMQKGRAGGAVVSLENKIYAIGGYNYYNNTGSMEEYDVLSNSWQKIINFNNGNDGQCQALVVNNKIYTMLTDNMAHIAEYDPGTNNWIEKTTLLSPVMDFCKIVVNGQIYIVGGHPTANLSYSTAVIKYNPATNIQTFLPNISQWMSGIVEVNGIIYVIGGRASNGSTTTKVVKYDTNNN